MNDSLMLELMNMDDSPTLLINNNFELDDWDFYFDTNSLQINKYNFCCLCGRDKYYHKNIPHHYYSAKDKYRCQKCNKFFYEHDHKKNPCFTPFEYLN